MSTASCEALIRVRNAPHGLIVSSFLLSILRTSLTAADNNNQTILWSSAGGSTVTLPAATGSGARFRLVVSTLATTTNHIVQAANSSDVMIGVIFMRDDTAANAEAYASTGTSDTITLNRSTSGGVSLGEWVEAEDIATNTWHVTGFLTNTGTSITPFSAAV
jgi:hypothetical protein